MADKATPGPKLDPFYDFELVVFKVENTLFRVPKQGFTASGTTFESRFVQSNDAQNAPGQSLDDPVELKDADEKSFKAFLRALYPFMWQGPVEEYDDWLSVLRLATKWKFDQIREKAIQALLAHSTLIIRPDANSTEKIRVSLQKLSIGRSYNIPTWVVEQLRSLVTQQGLTPQSFVTPPVNVGWETAAKVFNARRALAKRHQNSPDAPCPHDCDCVGEVILSCN